MIHRTNKQLPVLSSYYTYLFAKGKQNLNEKVHPLWIHSVVCEYQFGRAGWGKRRQLSWYDVLERVCGGLLGIRKVVCGYLLERVCWGTCRQLWWYEVVLRFSSGWT